ncbi:MAG: hypothetical protein M3Z27_08710 [Actinomycetota bacterium]|nr:hypothetical protein [Actinomycetota bacterium]
MNFKAVDRGELIAIVGGIVLGVSLFLTWYTLNNKFTMLEQCKHPLQPNQPPVGCTGWNTLGVISYVLALAALAPLILTYVIVRGHALSWPRGELTAVTAMTALTLILFRGLIQKPGTPIGQISVGLGWWIGLLGGLLILAGSILRSQESAGRRKPPGVL